ncbi:MAG: hypothetical protein ACRCYY_15165 [Trueperaceae bacterium]
MPKQRRELIRPKPTFVETYFEEGGEEPLFRHGQEPLRETAYAHIAELVSTTPTEGESYWTFKTLAEQVQRGIKA